MPFDIADPRAKLGEATSQAEPPSAIGSTSYVKFYESEPSSTSSTEVSWLARAQHFLVEYSEIGAGGQLRRQGQADEYFLLVPDSDTVEVVANGETSRLDGRCVVIIPPGHSSVTLPDGGRVVRVFTIDGGADLIELCANRDAYTDPAPNLAPLVPWPEPAGGYRVRVYSLDVEPDSSRYGRVWRSRSLMVNYSYPRPGPRDVTKMSPHAHDDFEQASLVLDGSFVHHIRWPWTTDMRLWREDEHEICAGPSLAVIPALVVHTSQQVGREINQLVDIFAPPRVDFSQLDGWVLNADEYPMPS